MDTLVLKELVKNTGSNAEGEVLYSHLEKYLLEKSCVILHVSENESLSSSFLNSSIGYFIEKHGMEKFRKTVKFKGTKTQFERLKNYIERYTKQFVS